jgi:hypothetical protein
MFLSFSSPALSTSKVRLKISHLPYINKTLNFISYYKKIYAFDPIILKEDRLIQIVVHAADCWLSREVICPNLEELAGQATY